MALINKAPGGPEFNYSSADAFVRAGVDLPETLEVAVLLNVRLTN